MAVWLGVMLVGSTRRHELCIQPLCDLGRLILQECSGYQRVTNGGAHHCLECLPNQKLWQIALIDSLCYIIGSVLESQ
jgi:hypothetical protein